MRISFIRSGLNSGEGRDRPSLKLAEEAKAQAPKCDRDNMQAALDGFRDGT